MAAIMALTGLLQCVACRRVGGAFGGKVARSMPVAAAAAVAAAKTGRRVRYSLDRNDDMRINGGTPVAWEPLLVDLEHRFANLSLLMYRRSMCSASRLLATQHASKGDA